MAEISYDAAPVSIRSDLADAHRRVWRRMAAPGTWLTGRTRVAVAAETRNAPNCTLCRDRKEALSPYGVEGIHDHLSVLSAAAVEMIHRITTDPARLKRDWFQGLIDDGLPAEEYVEILGVICTTISVDTFAKALGMVPPALPEPTDGAPSKRRPDNATQGAAWVPWVAPEDAVGDDLETFGPEASNVRRALSLVPAEAHGFMELVAAQYLSADQMMDFDNEPRAISRQQIELIAGRVSAINQCAY